MFKVELAVHTDTYTYIYFDIACEQVKDDYPVIDTRELSAAIDFAKREFPEAKKMYLRIAHERDESLLTLREGWTARRVIYTENKANIQVTMLLNDTPASFIRRVNDELTVTPKQRIASKKLAAAARKRNGEAPKRGFPMPPQQPEEEWVHPNQARIDSAIGEILAFEEKYPDQQSRPAAIDKEIHNRRTMIRIFRENMNRSNR